MRKTITAFVSVLAVLLLASAPAAADLYVAFSLDNAALDYTAAGNTMNIGSTSGSTLTLQKKDDAEAPWTYKDSATVAASDIGFLLDLTFTDLAGTNNWSAAGTLTMTDEAGNVTQASFTSTKIEISAIGWTHHLDIEGLLSPASGNSSILLDQGGNAWAFEGTGDLGGNNDDGVSNQITMIDPAAYDSGTLWTFDFGVAEMGEDTFFGSNRASGDVATGWGNLSGSMVALPVPAAVVLGMIGLGLVGWRMRKYA